MPSFPTEDIRSGVAAGVIDEAQAARLIDIGSGKGRSIAITLLVTSAFITALGTWWVQLRAVLMHALPDFALKSKLPPYQEAL